MEYSERIRRILQKEVSGIFTFELVKKCGKWMTEQDCIVTLHSMEKKKEIHGICVESTNNKELGRKYRDGRIRRFIVLNDNKDKAAYKNRVKNMKVI